MTAESKSDDERVNGLFDGLAQAVTWARMKRAESLVDLKALMTLIAMTMTMMEASMVASMALMASMASMVAPRVSVVASMASMASLVESRKWLKRRAAEPKRYDERVNGLAHSDELTL